MRKLQTAPQRQPPKQAAQTFRFRIRVSLQRYRKFCFVSGYRFSDTASFSESDAPLGAVHRFSRNPMERSIEVPAPEGRPNLAQRFSAGKSERNEPSPGGTLHNIVSDDCKRLDGVL